MLGVRFIAERRGTWYSCTLNFSSRKMGLFGKAKPSKDKAAKAAQDAAAYENAFAAAPPSPPPPREDSAKQDPLRQAAAAESAKRQAAEAEKKKLLERQAKERLAKEKEAAEKEAAEKAAAAKREADAKAKAKREAEAKAKEKQEAEDFEWKRTLARMSSAAVLTQQLEKELAKELEEVRGKLEMGTQAVETIEAEISEVDKTSAAHREAKAADIAALSGHTTSFEQVLRIVRGFESECVSLEDEARFARETLEQSDANAAGIAERLEEEAADAQKRLERAEGKCAELESKLAALKAEAGPKEKSAEDKARALSGVAIAARLKHSFGTRTVEILTEELSRLRGSDEQVRRYQSKRARADETRIAVEKLRAQLSEDEAAVRRLALAGESDEAAVEAQRKADERVSSSYEHELESARKLVATQGAFVEVAGAKAKQIEHMPARSLLEIAAKMAEEGRDATQKALGHFDEEKRAKHRAAEAPAEAARGASKLHAAERQAAEATRAEHARYLEQLERQLEAEEREATAALKPIDGRDESISLVEIELASAKTAADALDKSATEAEEAYVGATKKLASLRQQHKSAISGLTVQIESEHSVTREHSHAVERLKNRLRLAREAVPSAADLEVRRMGVGLLVDTSKKAKKAVEESEEAMRRHTEAEKAAAEELSVAESKAAATLESLREQLAATRAAVVNLKTYETSLSELVARGQVRIAAAGEASEQSGGGGADGADGGGGGGGGGPDLQLAGRAASRFSLITKPDVVAIATDVVLTAGGGQGGGAGGDGKPAPPPTLAKLQCQADEAIGVINAAAKTAKSDAERSAPPVIDEEAASTAEAKAAHARKAAQARADAQRAKAEERAKAMADAQAKFAEPATPRVSLPDPDRLAESSQPKGGSGGGGGGGGPSEVDTWLDKKLLGSCKKGLAGIGVLSLMDLANMDASAIKGALSGVDAATRSKLMKAIENIEL